MKAFFCLNCNDLMAIHTGMNRVCRCGQSGGKYEENGSDSLFWGFAVPIGIGLESIFDACMDRREVAPEGQWKRYGWPIIAWVYPERAGTINRGGSTRCSLGLEFIAKVLSSLARERNWRDVHGQLAYGLRAQLRRKMKIFKESVRD